MDNNNRRESREEYRKRMEERIQKQVNENRQREEEEQTTAPPRYQPDDNNYQGPQGNFEPPVKHHYKMPNWMRALIWLLIILVALGGFYEYHKVHSAATGMFANGDGKISKKLQRGEPVSVLVIPTRWNSSPLIQRPRQLQ